MYRQQSNIQTPEQDSGQTYNNETVFPIENRGFLTMLFLIFDITPSVGGPDFSTDTPTSPYIPEYVYLESNGSIISKLTTQYILGRMDELNTTEYKKIESGASIEPAVATKQTCSLPLFFSAIDGQKVNLNEYKNLVVRCRTKSDFVKMGFNKDATVRTKLKVIYERPSDYSELRSGPKLTNFYNCEQLPPVLLPNGTSEQRLWILNPHEITNIYLMIRKGDQGRINKVIAHFPSGRREEFDNSTNYTISNIHSDSEESIFWIHFASRKKADNYMKTNLENCPLFLDVYFNPVGADDFKLHCCVEYLSKVIENRVVDTIHLVETEDEKM